MQTFNQTYQMVLGQKMILLFLLLTVPLAILNSQPNPIL